MLIIIDQQVPNLKSYFFWIQIFWLNFFFLSFIFIIPVLHVTTHLFILLRTSYLICAHNLYLRWQRHGSCSVSSPGQAISNQSCYKWIPVMKEGNKMFFSFLYPFICHCTVPYAPLNFLVCYDNQSALRDLLIIMHVAMCHVVVKYLCSLSLSSSLNKFVFCMTYNRTNEYLSFLFFFLCSFVHFNLCSHNFACLPVRFHS